jgi:magnesium transporter
MFIPLVLTLSEAVSIQAMSICLQQLHAAKFTWSTITSRLTNEFGAVFMLGVFCALFVGGIAFLWRSSGMPFVSSISLSIGVSMMCAGMIGTGMPLILHLLKLDPKVAAGPIVLMATDIIATFLYLGLATLLIVR